MSRNTEWHDRSLAAVWHPCTQMKAHAAEGAQLPLVPVARAEGLWLYDHDGGRLLDGISSWWVNLFGHGHPAIRDALIDQLHRLDHVMLAGFTHAPVVELSERLSALTGLGHAFYGSDGASATEIALKMSAHFWRNQGRPGKNRFIGLAGGYHGETVGALAVTDIALFRESYAPLVRLAATVPSPDARLAQPGETAEDVANRAADALADWLAEHADETAALILEPLVQCATGMAMHHPRYLRGCARCATARGASGGRRDRGGLRPHRQLVRPPAGRHPARLHLPVQGPDRRHAAAVGGADHRRGLCRLLRRPGGPRLPALAQLHRQPAGLPRRAGRHRAAGPAGPGEGQRGQRARLWRQFEGLSQHPRVRFARRQGMIFAWDVATSLPDFARRFARHALAQGVLLRPIGNTVYAMPPLVISETEGEFLAQAALAALNTTLAEETGGAPSTHGVVDGV
jgi:adenosylmethionine-8-amino-7-oxononanoate aminotransferase